MNKLFLMGFVFALTACTHNPQPLGKPLPQLTYEHLNAYAIHGGAVLIQQSFKPDAQTVRLAEQFPVAPDALIQRYANRRFVTSGAPEKLVFDLKQASLSKVADEDNIVGFLSGAAEDYYKMDIVIAMTPVRVDGHRAAPFTIKINRELFIPQNASLAEREFRQFEMLEKAMLDIDRAVTDMVQNKMTANYF